MSQLHEWLDLLEQELQDGGKFFGRKTDTEKCLEILTRIRRELPAVIEEAAQIVTAKNRIIDAARKTGEQIVASADARAQKTLNENGLIAQAESAAMQIAESAEQTAARLFDNNAQLIASMHDSMLRFLSEMQKQTASNKDRFLRACDTESAPRRRTAKARR